MAADTFSSFPVFQIIISISLFLVLFFSIVKRSFGQVGHFLFQGRDHHLGTALVLKAGRCSLHSEKPIKANAI